MWKGLARMIHGPEDSTTASESSRDREGAVQFWRPVSSRARLDTTDYFYGDGSG